MPAYVVFTDATLTAIAEAEPADQGALATISGVGVRKLEQYGADVLAILGGASPRRSSKTALAQANPRTTDVPEKIS